MSAIMSEQVEALFVAAMALPEGERTAFLNESCGRDRALRQTVASLLTAANDAEDYFSALGQRLGLEAFLDGDNDIPPSETIGAYRLIRLLGRGGMGAVYLAERADSQFEKRVAIKVLPMGVGSEEVQRRFRAERQILAQLEHPGIARLLDGGVTVSGTPYFVMEYVAGQPIDAHCDANTLDIDARLRLFCAVCDAVNFAHRNLVIHRDLKPGNILVTESGDVRLVDFGVAKLLDPQTQDASLTRVGAVPMTPAFASPEMVRGESVTTASDVYALGVLLYSLLTGRPPYRLSGLAQNEIIETICERVPPVASAIVNTDATQADASGERPLRAEEVAAARATTPAQLANRLRGDLDTILAKALHKDVAQRYQSVEQIEADIRRFREGLPVVARPPSMSYRGGKFVRRHKAGVAAAAVVAVALLAVAGLATRYAVTTKRQAQAIAQERDAAVAVQRFWLETFNASETGARDGDALSAQELLDRGARRVRDRVSAEPGAQATLLSTIGAAYAGLSLYSEALEQHRHALQLRRQAHPDGSPLVADSLAQMARAHEQLGDYDQAARLVEEALPITRRVDDRAAMADLVTLKGRLGLHTGDLVAARKFLSDALAMHRELHGEQHEAVADVQSDLGTLHYYEQDYDQAIDLLRQALATRRALHGDDPDRLISTLVNLAVTLIKVRQYEEARALLLESLGATTPDAPGEFMRRAFSLNGLGLIDRDTGKLGDAEVRFREAIAIAREHDTDGNSSVARMMQNLGRVLIRQGKVDAAKPVLNEALELLSSNVPDHPVIDTLRVDLGVCYSSEDAHGQAESLLLQGLEGLRQSRGDEHEETQRALLALGDLYEQWGKPGKARDYRSQLVAGRPDP